jgi:L-threonylcarbamoyladenylate synthase
MKRTVRSRLAAPLLRAVVADLRAGGTVIFPTETVYGLGTSAFSPQGIRRIYQLKGRSWRKPLAVLVPDLTAARPLIEMIPREAFRLAKAFMPGPLTLVFKASALGRLLMAGKDTIGVRVPDHPIALQILKAVGVPLATTSVNRSGQEPAASGAAAEKIFGAKVNWLLDGGACRVKEASSVVDVSHYPYTIIRAGAISKRALGIALEGR